MQRRALALGDRTLVAEPLREMARHLGVTLDETRDDWRALAVEGLRVMLDVTRMPPRGSRLKNAHLPLPRSFEVVLEGETKQVLEAAHFLWRSLRHLAVYGRGDDPAPGVLVADGHLEQVMAQQPFMTPASARLHIARIRDWRESQPGLT